MQLERVLHLLRALLPHVNKVIAHVMDIANGLRHKVGRENLLIKVVYKVVFHISRHAGEKNAHVTF